MEITAEHLRHLANRHHATMKQLDTLRGKFAGVTGRFVNTFETAAGAWLGGTIEGRTDGASIGPLPVNLGIGTILLIGGHFKAAGEHSEHLNQVGNGFIASYLAATGFAFGKRWKETGKLVGGGGRPWTSPYENGWAKPASDGTP